MDDLIREAMVCTKRLAVIAKSSGFDHQQTEVLRQSVFNGQIIVQSLHTVKTHIEKGDVDSEYEFLATYFCEQAETYLRNTKKFIENLDAVNG